MKNEFRIKVDHENLKGTVSLDGVEIAKFDLVGADYSLTRMAAALAGFYEETQGTLIDFNEAVIEKLGKIVVRAAGIALGREMKNAEPDIRFHVSGKIVASCYPVTVESVGCDQWKARVEHLPGTRSAAVSEAHGGYGYALEEILGVPFAEIIKVD